MTLVPALLVFALMIPVAANAACPIGTIPSADNFGNNICKSIDTGQTRTIERPRGPNGVNTCPNGQYPTVDNFGNRVCQSFDSRQRSYDTSKGCPIGTFPSVDNFGNPTCRRP